jgi:ArsR family transcriptional regulator, virulence genes transcriptional regulator
MSAVIDLDFAVMNMAAMAPKAEAAAQLLSAMANPVRLLLLCTLLEGEKSVNELVARCTISQSAVSQHLAKMRILGLVATRRDGQTIYYRVASQQVREVMATLYGLFCTPEAA